MEKQFVIGYNVAKRAVKERIKEMLSKKNGKKLTAYVADYVVFDLETTGVSCVRDEVVEIAAVKVAGGTIIDEFRDDCCS